MGITKVKAALERLTVLHDHHIQTFDTEILPDIETQMTQRREEFSRLKESIDTLVLEISEMDPDTERHTLDDLINHIQGIVSQNKRLESKVRDHKNGLEKSMKQLRLGKKAMHGYGSNAYRNSSPKVIKTTN